MKLYQYVKLFKICEKNRKEIEISSDKLKKIYNTEEEILSKINSSLCYMNLHNDQ